MKHPHDHLHDAVELRACIHRFVRVVRVGAMSAESARESFVECLPPDLDANAALRQFDDVLTAHTGETVAPRPQPTTTPIDATGHSADRDLPEQEDVDRRETISIDTTETPVTDGTVAIVTPADGVDGDRCLATQIDAVASCEPPHKKASAPDASEMLPTQIDEGQTVHTSAQPSADGCPCGRPGRVVDTPIVAALFAMTEGAVRDAVRKNKHLVNGVWTANLWSGVVATQPAQSRTYKYWVPEGLFASLALDDHRAAR